MISIQAKNAVNMPKCICDSCGRSIDDAKMAGVVFPNFMEDGQSAEPLYVHKNSVHGGCMAMAEEKIKKAGGRPGWDELTSHLAHLMFNVGMSAKEVSAELSS